MIKAIGLRKVDVSQEEWNYYQEIIAKHSNDKQKGSLYFEDLFETDKQGIITIIKAAKEIPWEVLFFIQNLMINQNLRMFDSRICKIEEKIGVKNDK